MHQIRYSCLICPHITPQCSHRHAFYLPKPSRPHIVPCFLSARLLALLLSLLLFFIVIKFNTFFPTLDPPMLVDTLVVPSGGLEERVQRM